MILCLFNQKTDMLQPFACLPSASNIPACSKATTLDIFLFLGVRLVGGSSNAGRVEVYYEGIWGAVCGNDWDIDDAHVVCTQLGFRYAIDAYQSARYGQRTGPILLGSVGCFGHESSLFSCKHSGVGSQKCYHSDASVRCGNTGGENN